MPFNPRDSRDSLAQAGGVTHLFIGDDPLAECASPGCGLGLYAAVHGDSWKRFHTPPVASDEGWDDADEWPMR